MIVGTHTTRESISLWQLFIPLDDTREEYITNCYNTNTVSIASRNGEVVSDVPIGDLALQQLEFPLEGEFGSHMIVGNVTTEGHEQLVILDVMRSYSQFENNQESTYRFGKYTPTGDAEVIIRGKKGNIIMNVDGTEDDSGKVIINITNDSGSGELQINVNGEAKVTASSITNKANDSITDELSIDPRAKNETGQFLNEDDYKTLFTKTINGFQVDMTKQVEGEEVKTTIKYETDTGFSYLDEFSNSITFGEGLLDLKVMLDAENDEFNQIFADAEKMEIISQGIVNIFSAEEETINLGDGAEQMVLGNILAQLLKDLITEISIATTPSGPLGNAAAIAAFTAEVDNILSAYSNTQ